MLLPSTTTFFEHQDRTYAELGWPPDHPAIEQIERLNTLTGAELLHVGRHKVKASQFVGVLRVGGTTIQVLPKVDCDPTGNPDAPDNSPLYRAAEQSATHNLLHMLSYTHDLQVRDQDLAGLHLQRADWFELLTRLFAANLHRLIQAGLEHCYRAEQDTLPVVRGRWIIERQVTQHPHVRHRFDVSYDVFSPDTALNRVFAFVVAQLIPRTIDPGNRRLLVDLRDWLADVPVPTTISNSDLDQVYFTRLNDRFRPAFGLARLFIENMVLQARAGALESFAFVFDMNRLFEEFVACFINRYRRDVLPSQWNSVAIRPQAQGQSIYLAEYLPNHKPVFRLIPDILLTIPLGKVVLIIDTKYKRLQGSDQQHGPAEGDAYQMLAYAVRLDCDRVVILYPQTALSGPVRLELAAHGFAARLTVATLNLRQRLDRPAGLISELREILTPALTLTV